MPDARYVREWDEFRLTAAAAIGVGEIFQLADGRAAVYQRVAGGRSEGNAATGDLVELRSSGKHTVTLTAGITILKGGRVFWDHSANAATFRKVNDRDFYIGRATETTTGGTVEVDLNIDPRPDIDALLDAVLSVPVGTQAVGGFGFPKILGGSRSLELTATSEAQKIDMLSVDGFAKNANAIIEFVYRVADDGAGTAADFNIGVANGTNATDADAITESIFFHHDANNTNINAESDDGTNEVPATDTTKDYTEGSAVANRVEGWIDMRNPASVKLYINGEAVLTGTTFNVDASTGPWFLLAHLEKTSAADVYRVIVDRLCARFMEQD